MDPQSELCFVAEPWTVDAPALLGACQIPITNAVKNLSVTELDGVYIEFEGRGHAR